MPSTLIPSKPSLNKTDQVVREATRVAGKNLIVPKVVREGTVVRTSKK
jgi:hypothetical protein